MSCLYIRSAFKQAHGADGLGSKRHSTQGITVKLSQIAVAAALALSGLSASAASYIIDFNTLGQADDTAISNSFGDVAGIADISYADAFFFSTGYADQATGGSGPGAAAYVFNNGNPGVMTITIAPLAGAASMTLNSMGVGQYVTPPPNSSYQVASLNVFDGASNFLGSTSGLPSPSFTYAPNFTSTTGFVIKFGPDGEYNGINNIRYTVTPVPEPGTYALLLAGLGAVGLVARRRRASANDGLTAA
jgi:hypothetical protein